MSAPAAHATVHPKYRPDIDGLRAVAVLLVLIFHGFPNALRGGFVGVDVFFVISGFLISSILYQSFDKNGFSYLDFYSRRIRRIFPSLFVVLSTCLVFGWFALLADEYAQIGKHVASGVAFISNLVLWSESGYFDTSAELKPLLHLWSLGVEEQFYIFWPLVLGWAWRRKLNLLNLIQVSWLVFFLWNLLRVGSHPTEAYYSPETRFWELLTGAWLAHVSLYKPERLARLSPFQVEGLSFLGGLLIVLGGVFLNKERQFPGWWALMPVMGSAMLIAAGMRAWINRKILANKVFVWVGLISFPLYLWHWPLLVFLRLVGSEQPSHVQRLTALGAAVVLAWLTCRWVEAPIRFSKYRWTPHWLAGALALVGLAGLGVFLGDGLSSRTAAHPKVVNAGDIGHDEVQKLYATRFRPCEPEEIRREAPTWGNVPRCLQSKAGPIDVAIIGDSHAEHLFLGLAEAMPDKNVVYYTVGALPVVSKPEFGRIFKSVAESPSIKKVLIASFWRQRQGELAGGTRLGEELKKTIEFLGTGKKVYLLDDTPGFSFGPKYCKYEGNAVAVHQCTESVARLAGARSRYVGELASVVAAQPQVTLVQPFEYLCEAGECFMAKGGQLLYRDPHHLNIPGSRFFAAKLLAEHPDLAK